MLTRYLLAAALLLALSHPAEARPRHHHKAHHARSVSRQEAFWPSWSGSSLVERARSYIGTNPTGWRHLWCAKFLAMIAPGAAARVRNPNIARDWASLPHTSPHVGAIAVLSRRGGGHIGVVSGFDKSGNPVIVSGNHGHRVGESVYPRSRVIAWVSGE